MSSTLGVLLSTTTCSGRNDPLTRTSIVLTIPRNPLRFAGAAVGKRERLMPTPEDEENEARKEKAATGFALMLETACEDFEIMRRLVSGELAVVPKGPKLDFRASPRITMALAKSFIFHVVRAGRFSEPRGG